MEGVKYVITIIIRTRKPPLSKKASSTYIGKKNGKDEWGNLEFIE